MRWPWRREEPEQHGAWADDDTGRPRVLIEHPDAAERSVLEHRLEEAGFSVASCGGPDATEGRACPLAVDGACVLVAHADVIVHGLPIGHQENREVLRLLRARYPDTPLVVEMPRPEAERYPGTLEGCTVLPFPARGDEIVRAVREAVASSA
jgi:CheY-like chemotaxis protein